MTPSVKLRANLKPRESTEFTPKQQPAEIPVRDYLDTGDTVGTADTRHSWGGKGNIAIVFDMKNKNFRISCTNPRSIEIRRGISFTIPAQLLLHPLQL